MTFLSRQATLFAFLTLGLVGHHHNAFALNNVSYVATVGAGNLDCSSATNACATLGTALANTDDFGVIVCISGGISPSAVTITKPVTIECGAQGHTVLQVIVNAPGRDVRIVGLTINGVRGGNPILNIQNAASVSVERSSIGTPAASGNGGCISDTRAGPSKLIIKDTSIHDCGRLGILVAPASGTLTAAFDGVRVTNSGYGLAVGSGGRVMITRSMFSANSIAGVEADAGAIVGLNDSLVSSNNIGVQPFGTVAISNSDINSNNIAISGPTRSYGNNRLFANVSDGTPPTPAGAASTDTGQR